MRHKIGIISPSITMTERFRAALAGREPDLFLLRQSHSRNAVHHAKEMIAEGVRVIISRGQTAFVVRNGVDIPVVDVRHTFFDCFNAYREARKNARKIAFLATSAQFEKTIRKSIAFMEDAEIIVIRDSDSGRDTDAKLLDLRARGVTAMIGGLSLRERAEAMGFLYVMSATDEDSVREAVDEALHFLRIELERDAHARELERRYETIESIFQCVSDAVVALDNDGLVARANNRARRILGDSAVGRSLAEILGTRVFDRVLKKGLPVTGEVVPFRRQSLVVNAEPVRIGGEVGGATVTLQQARQILAAERKIRSIMFDKGHKSDKTMGDIVGGGAALRNTKALAEKYAAAEGSVLLLGETGTGKELFAQSIHNASRRRDAPFVAINCASLPLNILESELFGYVKGAFTGARSEGKAGFFELAHHGTIFLDEISETPLDVQLRLLRVLEERKTMRIGDDTLLPVDVRVITASNKDLTRLIREGLFREDLYYRICVLELRLPSLRERREDIPALAERFIRESAAGIRHVDKAAMDALAARDWPGNVRQLRNCIERIGAIAEGDRLTAALVERALGAGGGWESASVAAAAPRAPQKSAQKDAVHRQDSGRDSGRTAGAGLSERELLRRILMEEKGNRKRAAERLGISTTTLWRTMRRILREDAGYFDTVKYGDLPQDFNEPQ